MHQTHISDDVIARVVRRQGKRYAYDRIDPATTALLVIDMQNYFVEMEKYACGDDGAPCPEFPHGRDIAPNINRLAARLRGAGGMVIWVLNGAPAETLTSWANLHELYLPQTSQRRLAGLAEDSSGFALWSGMEPAEEDVRVIKTRYSALIEGSSDLDRLLSDRGIDTVLIAGVATNVCCESTGRDAMMLGYRTIMVSDANATMTDEEHNMSLANFMTFFGDVQSTDVAIAHLASGSPGQA